MAEPTPGFELETGAVFGHAAALAGDELVLIDGVSVIAGGFRIAPQSWYAGLEPATPATITWTQLPDHPGPARYRAAGGNVGDRSHGCRSARNSGWVERGDGFWKVWL